MVCKPRWTKPVEISATQRSSAKKCYTDCGEFDSRRPQSYKRQIATTYQNPNASSQQCLSLAESLATIVPRANSCPIAPEDTCETDFRGIRRTRELGTFVSCRLPRGTTFPTHFACELFASGLEPHTHVALAQFTRSTIAFPPAAILVMLVASKTSAISSPLCTPIT